MTEPEYWSHLEYRLCDEFRGLPDRCLRALWCDGLIPDVRDYNLPQPHIRGLAHIVTNQHYEEWSFRLLLPIVPADDFDWSKLLPPSDVTRWLGVDLQRKYLEIEPAAAVPDET